jgi:hypothetical protein
MSESLELITIHKPVNETEFSILSSLLEKANIRFYVKNSKVQDLFGWGRFGTGYNLVTGPMILQVEKKHFLKARGIVEEYLTNIKDDSETDPELEVLSKFRRYLNLSILMGIFFPSLGIYHLIKSIKMKMRYKKLLRSGGKLLISFFIFIIGLLVVVMAILDWFKIVI